MQSAFCGCTKVMTKHNYYKLMSNINSVMPLTSIFTGFIINIRHNSSSLISNNILKEYLVFRLDFREYYRKNVSKGLYGTVSSNLHVSIE